MYFPPCNIISSSLLMTRKNIPLYVRALKRCLNIHFEAPHFPACPPSSPYPNYYKNTPSITSNVFRHKLGISIMEVLANTMQLKSNIIVTD